MKYTDSDHGPKSFRALTGLRIEDFQVLPPYYTDAHNDYLFRHEMNGRRRGGSRSFVIYGNSPFPTVEDRLFFVPVCLKNNPLQEYHAACFGMEQKQCNTFIHGLYHILEPSLADTLYDFHHFCILYQDTGYQSYAPASVLIAQPIKKPGGGELTPEQKEYNRQVSSFRVRIEHAIGSVKYMRIVKDECRLRAGNFVQRIFRTCAALHNLKVRNRPWHYENKLT